MLALLFSSLLFCPSHQSVLLPLLTADSPGRGPLSQSCFFLKTFLNINITYSRNLSFLFFSCKAGLQTLIAVSLSVCTGCPTKKFTSFKPICIRPLILLRKSSVLEMNLRISSFKNTNLKFSRIFVFGDIKGIRYYSRFS